MKLIPKKKLIVEAVCNGVFEEISRGITKGISKKNYLIFLKKIEENHHKGIVERDSIGVAEEVSAGIHSVISEKIL